MTLPPGEELTGAIIDMYNTDKIFEDWDDATPEIVAQEKIHVFWIVLPPIPKGFDEKRYSIEINKIAWQIH